MACLGLRAACAPRAPRLNRAPPLRAPAPPARAPARRGPARGAAARPLAPPAAGRGARRPPAAVSSEALATLDATGERSMLVRRRASRGGGGGGGAGALCTRPAARAPRRAAAGGAAGPTPPCALCLARARAQVLVDNTSDARCSTIRVAGPGQSDCLLLLVGGLFAEGFAVLSSSYRRARPGAGVRGAVRAPRRRGPYGGARLRDAPRACSNAGGSVAPTPPNPTRPPPPAATPTAWWSSRCA